MKKIILLFLAFSVTAMSWQVQAQESRDANNSEDQMLETQKINNQVKQLIAENGTTTRIPSGSLVFNYLQDGYGVDVGPLLTSMGGTVTSATGHGNLNTLLPSQALDLVILQVHNYSLEPAEITALDNYVSGGGKLIMSLWSLNGQPTVQTIVGVSNTISFNSPLPVSVWDGAHPIFTTPNVVSGLSVNGNSGGSDN